MIRQNIRKFNFTREDMLANKVIVHLNVLSPGVEEGILRKMDVVEVVTVVVGSSPVLSTTYVPKYTLCALKVLLGWPHHELTNPTDRVTEVRPGDGQVYEASDYPVGTFSGRKPFRSQGEALRFYPYELRRTYSLSSQT